MSKGGQQVKLSEKLRKGEKRDKGVIFSEKMWELRFCETGEIIRASATFHEPSDAAAKSEEGLNRKEKSEHLSLNDRQKEPKSDKKQEDQILPPTSKHHRQKTPKA